MPPHPDRVRRNYIDICEICLSNPIYLFASRNYLALNRYNICLDCLNNRKNNGSTSNK